MPLPDLRGKILPNIRWEPLPSKRKYNMRRFLRRSRAEPTFSNSNGPWTSSFLGLTILTWQTSSEVLKEFQSHSSVLGTLLTISRESTIHIAPALEQVSASRHVCETVPEHVLKADISMSETVSHRWTGKLFVFRNELGDECVAISPPPAVTDNMRLQTFQASGPYVPLTPGKSVLVDSASDWMARLESNGFKFEPSSIEYP
jgi:hypothetical protein